MSKKTTNTIDHLLDAHTDINLTIELYKGFSYDEKQKFIKSNDGMVFFRKIRYSPLFKGLPAQTARLVDILGGTYNGGTHSREGQLAEEFPTAQHKEEPPAIFEHKSLNPSHVENCITVSSTEPADIWLPRMALMKHFKASGASIDKALDGAVTTGRVAALDGGNDRYYAMSY